MQVIKQILHQQAVEIKVPLVIKGIKEFKGFLLKEDIELESDIVVLTGRNGSGKTRLLESIMNRSSEVFIDGQVLSKLEVSMIAQTALHPNFGAAYNDAQFERKIKLPYTFLLIRSYFIN